MASPVGGEQDPVRQVSVLVHRSDGSSQALDPVPASFPSMYLPRPPPAVERGGGTHTLRSLLRRVWQGGEELGSSTRRLEVSFSTGQPRAGHLEAMPSQEGMINQGPGPGPLRDEPLPAGAPSVSALPGALPAPSDDANLADEAEHHRLSTSIGLNLADLGGGVEINAPYLALMLLIFAWRSAAVLALWAGLTALLRRLNRAATTALTDKGAADARALLGRGLAAVLAAAVCAAYLLRPAGRLEAARRGFWATLLLVVAADTCFRILVAAAKLAAIASMVADDPRARRRRSALLTWLEHATLALRTLGPAPLWLTYLGGAGLAAQLPYLAIKAVHARRLGAAALAATRQLGRGDNGVPPSAEEVAEAGSVCPICQEPPTLPVKLPCSHIFCDACVAEWFERERSCPMCRAVTGETRVKSCSDGQTSLMPLLF
ncbi:hypothetical protein ACKKBG_A19565 [Auxenochlorella protothecoides x Auxenochlorella symbiontica]